MFVPLSEYTKYIELISAAEDEIKTKCTSCENCLDFVYKSGNIPILLSASQSTCHLDKNIEEQTDIDRMYTGLLVYVLGRLTNIHIIYTNTKLGFNQDKIDVSPFKSLVHRVIKEYKIKLFIDLQGGVQSNYDINLTTGGIGRPYLKQNQFIYKVLLDNLKTVNIDNIGENSSIVEKNGIINTILQEDLDVSLLGINISPKYRQPNKNSLEMAKLARALACFVNNIKYEIPVS